MGTNRILGVEMAEYKTNRFTDSCVSWDDGNERSSRLRFSVGHGFQSVTESVLCVQGKHKGTWSLGPPVAPSELLTQWPVLNLFWQIPTQPWQLGPEIPEAVLPGFPSTAGAVGSG